MENYSVNSQLLITFTTSKHVNEIIEDIKQAYKITFNKIFILQNIMVKKELVCSYNIDLDESIEEESIPKNTNFIPISISSHTF